MRYAPIITPSSQNTLINLIDIPFGEMRVWSYNSCFPSKFRSNYRCRASMNYCISNTRFTAATKNLRTELSKFLALMPQNLHYFFFWVSIPSHPMSHPQSTDLMQAHFPFLFISLIFVHALNCVNCTGKIRVSYYSCVLLDFGGGVLALLQLR